MLNRTKGTAVIALILLASILAAIAPYIASVKAQNQATVTIEAVTGGSTDPQPGTYTYADGAGVVLTATPDTVGGYLFQNWVISTATGNDTETQNPFTLTVAGGVAYDVSAVFFQPIQEPIVPPATNVSASAVVVVLHAVGGHTDPPEGTYYLAYASELKLTAIPDSGWQFDHWVISGGPITGHGGSPLTLTPTDNPYTVGHGYGYTYAYQPVFSPVSSGGGGGGGGGTSTGGFSTEAIIVIVALVVVIIIVAAIGAYAYTRRRPK